MSPRRRSKAKQVPRARRRKIAEEYLSGASLQALSIKYRISPATATSYIEEQGVEIRKPGGRKRQLTLYEIVEREYREKLREEIRPKTVEVVQVFDWDDLGQEDS